MTNSLLKVTMSGDEERFTFSVAAASSELEWTATLLKGSDTANDKGALTEEDLGIILDRMMATEEGDGDRLCSISLNLSDEPRTMPEFPVRRLLDETIVGRVYDRMKGA